MNTGVEKMNILIKIRTWTTSGLYYKGFTIVINDCHDSGQYYKTTIIAKASLS